MAATGAERMRTMRERRVAAGLCVYCGQEHKTRSQQTGEKARQCRDCVVKWRTGGFTKCVAMEVILTVPGRTVTRTCKLRTGHKSDHKDRRGFWWFGKSTGSGSKKGGCCR